MTSKSRVLMAKFDPRLVQYDEAQTQQFYKLVTERMREASGVRSAALTRNPPLSLDGFSTVAFVPDGFQMPRDRDHFMSAMDTVDEGFFQTMGVPILRGRGFLPSDTGAAPRVAVVNERLAKHYWPGADAVGKRIRLENGTGTPVEIVGVAQTIMYRDSLDRQMDFVYLPLAQHPVPKMILLLRTSGDPLQMVKPLKAIVRTLDPNMPMLETRTYEDLYRYAVVDGPGVASKLVGVLGAVGLILAIAGLYGLVAYNVNRRTREIGIRMAIGAAQNEVVRLVMRQGMRLVLLGTAIGLAGGSCPQVSAGTKQARRRPDQRCLRHLRRHRDGEHGAVLGAADPALARRSRNPASDNRRRIRASEIGRNGLPAARSSRFLIQS